jgi:hypothetical protein
MDDKMMKAGGAEARKRLIEQFGSEIIPSTVKRDYTAKEKQIIAHGDTGQGERLRSKKY